MHALATATALHGTGWPRALGRMHDGDTSLLVREQTILGREERDDYRSTACRVNSEASRQSRKILNRLLDQFRCGRIRISGRVVLHRAIASIAASLQNIE